MNTPDAHASSADQPIGHVSELHGVRVLIVEDEAPARRLLRSWLERKAAVVLEAASAEEALTVLDSEGEVAVAVCDLKLPGHDGFWLAEELQRVSPATAIVVATGVHEFDAALTSLHVHAVDYLHKPYPMKRLYEALGRALAVYRARRANRDMLHELERRRGEITEALADIEANTSSALDAMLGMLQAREPMAYDHAHRVAKLSVDLAMALEIAEPQLSYIERAALLHNLGRLGLPDLVLNTPPAKLSEEGRARLRAYPLHGYALLKTVPFFAGANEISVAAHERYDGSGFPRRLRGESIPLGSRIIGLADAYDELVSGIDCAPVPSARAIEILSGERAREFDPAVLAALKMLEPGTAQPPA